MSLNIELSNTNLNFLEYLNTITDKQIFLNYIVELGYNEYLKLKNLKFDNQFSTKQENTININTLLSKHTNDIYKLIDDKINVLSIYNNINAIDNKSRGTIGENIIYDFFKNNFNEFEIDDTSMIPHSGDFKLYIPEINEKIIIEVKNYKNTVDQKQIDKLYYDLNYSGINYGLFISLYSNISNKKNNIEWEITKINSKTNIVIFISNINDNLLFTAVYVLINLIKLIKSDQSVILNSSLDISKISNIINQIYLQKNCIQKIKNNILTLHNNISKNILELYNSIVLYENNLFYNINELNNTINKNLIKEVNNQDIEELPVDINKIGNINKLNDVLHQVSELNLQKKNTEMLELILSHFLKSSINYDIKIEDSKKILILNNNTIFYTIKILKNSINIITKDNLEIKNIEIINWTYISKLF
jgi:hypothetical protein